MQKFKPSDSDLPELQAAARCLKAANEALSKAKENVDGAKKTIADWLKNNRSVDLQVLPIGEHVLIEDVAIIKVGKMDKFDDKAFKLAEPTLHQAWVKPLRTLRFDPMA